MIEIYSDGACRGNPGPGGWGALLRFNDTEKEIFGGTLLTTNNRMELTSVIEALKLIKRPYLVCVYTDSQYVQKGATEWLAGWKLRGWKTASKAPVKNSDLWETLSRLAQPHQMQWYWVKGHAGHPFNERADRLANLGLEHTLAKREY